ncbi:HAL/PAL/TAL family ammonia-lyase [Peptoniphilus catoniae]|uniref:HAL/PAL/TAL family ammonia-lyase n=1 Tax=Peptoniphilus catoniae TaxID=1660341 RepID=UPI0010FF05A4|nr:aromatic amino acid ammonia-lyase [Peptoniphilus catoniae]
MKLNKTLTIEEAMAVVRFNEELEFSSEAIERVKRCTGLIEDSIKKNIPMYGVTTGLGANSTKNISQEDTKIYQEKILQSHAVSVGEPIKKKELRAILLMIILNGIKGYSGVRIETLELIRNILNKDLYIFVPGSGSVGYLSLEAHIGLALIGQGKIYKDGKFESSKEVLEENGLKPLDLSYKEALFLISGTTCVTGYGLIAVYDAKNLLKNFEILSAMEIEVQEATTRLLDKRLMEVRSQVEQREVADSISDMLKDSEICKKYYYEKLQDALSIRCIPQLIGPVKKKINEAELTVLREMDSCTDNPIIYEENGEVDVISGCNPDSSYIGLEMDCLSIALTMLGKMSDRRTFRLLDEKLSNKPAFLVENSGANSGLMITQYTQAGLLNEMKINATSGVIDSIPTCANQEDYVSMGFNSSKKVLKQIENLNYILAIELLCIYEANFFVDPTLKRASLSQRVYDKLNFVPRLREDFKLHPYIEKISEILKDGELINLI